MQYALNSELRLLTCVYGISFFDKDEHRPYELHIGCLFCITSMISKISAIFWMPAFDMIFGPWAMEKLANQFYFNNRNVI